MKYLIFREDCYARFEKFDFGDSDCVAFTTSKLIGYLIIGGSTFFKLPQVITILNQGSVEGISSWSYYFETTVFVHTLATSRHLDLPISVYGETMIIIAWNALIILMIYYYNKDIYLIEKVLFIVPFTAYSYWLISGTDVPEEFWPMVSSSNMAFNIMSRVPQIWGNFSSKSMGVLSFSMIVLAWVGGITRLATVLLESDDIYYQLPFITSNVLNSILLLQFFIYPSGATKV